MLFVNLDSKIYSISSVKIGSSFPLKMSEGIKILKMERKDVHLKVGVRDALFIGNFRILIYFYAHEVCWGGRRSLWCLIFSLKIQK